jgi:hypothetical protein
MRFEAFAKVCDSLTRFCSPTVSNALTNRGINIRRSPATVKSSLAARSFAMTVAESWKSVTTGVVVLGIIHVNKANTTDPLNSVMGSRAFSAVPRFVLFIIEDPNDPSVRLFGQPKNNLGPNQSTLTFEVETNAVSPDISTGRVVWTGEDARTRVRARPLPRSLG